LLITPYLLIALRFSCHNLAAGARYRVPAKTLLSPEEVSALPAEVVTAQWRPTLPGLVQALAANGGGLEPVLICAPAQAATLRMWRQADFYDILASVALPAGTVVAVESSSFVSGQDGVPEFSTSKGATLHMEDTAPTDINASAAMAAPTKSLFQTDLVGLKMILRAGLSRAEAQARSRFGPGEGTQEEN
jgi:hypothetical protein